MVEPPRTQAYQARHLPYVTTPSALPPMDFSNGIQDRLKDRIPAEVLARHPDFAKAALCGCLFRMGFEDERIIRESGGLEMDDAIRSIVRILEDPKASQVYFEAIDGLELQTQRARFPSMSA